MTVTFLFACAACHYNRSSLLPSLQTEGQGGYGCGLQGLAATAAPDPAGVSKAVA